MECWHLCMVTTVPLLKPGQKYPAGRSREGKEKEPGLSGAGDPEKKKKGKSFDPAHTQESDSHTWGGEGAKREFQKRAGLFRKYVPKMWEGRGYY